MVKNGWVILLIGSMLLTGCLEAGEGRYRYTDGKPPPLDVIARWLGAPLPPHYCDLKYEIVQGAMLPDPYARISVKVSEQYYRTVTRDWLDYDKVKGQLQYDLKPRERKLSTAAGDFIQKPRADTAVWVSQQGFYRQYAWYQDSTLYVVYASA